MNLDKQTLDKRGTRYSVNPKSIVCPGVLSKNVHRKLSSPSLRLQQKQSYKLLKDRISRANTTNQLVAVTSKSSLVVSPTQGIFQIRLRYLDLSDTGIKRIQNEFQGEFPSNVRLSWKFLSFDRTTIPLNNPTHVRYDIESSVLYKVDIDEAFFEYALNKHISLEFYARSKDKEVFLARGELKIAECLEYPSTDLYAYVEFCDADKALVLSHTGIAVVYGTLSLHYRLNCDTEILITILKRTGHIYYSPSTEDVTDQQRTDSSRKVSLVSRDASGRISRISQLTFHIPETFSDESDTTNSLEPTSSEIESFQDALNLVLSRNKALRTTQKEIDRELNQRTKWLHEESNWKRTLQEHAILCGKDPYQIEWRQWRDDDTANVKLRTYSSQVTLYEPEIAITIEYLKLYQKSSPVKNNKYKQFYVEYSFLSHEVEYPNNVPMATDGKRMYINFTETFPIDPYKNPENARQLAKAVKNETEIKFVVVGEPNEMTSGIPCCEEVSSCTINLLEMVKTDLNIIVESLPLDDPNEEGTEIGYLKVHISGIQAMRRVALKILAPPTYVVP